MIAGEDHNIFRVIAIDKIDILIDRVSGIFIPLCPTNFLIRGEDMYPSVHTVQIPWLSIANIIIELQRLESGKSMIRYFPP